MNDNGPAEVHLSTVTTILEPSDCTLMLPGFMLRLVAVSHHPVGDLLPRSIRNPFSSSRFCAAHMSVASVANSTSSSFTRSSKLAAICVRPFSVNAGRYSSFRRQSVSTGISNSGAMITSTGTKLGGRESLAIIRLSKGICLDTAASARHGRIRPPHLRAMEAGRRLRSLGHSLSPQ
jgi:hypothetical protein